MNTFDINAIINAAIQQALNTAITNYVDAYMANVQQEHRKEINALKAQIACMELDLTQLKAQPQVIQPADNPAAGTDMVLAKEVTLKLLQDNAAVKQAVYEIAYQAGHAVLDEHLESYDHEEYDRIVRFVDEDLPSDFPDFDDFVKHDDLSEAIRDAISIDDYVKHDDLSETIEEKLNEIVDMDEYVKEEDLPEFPDVDTLVTKDALSDAVREEVRNTIENRVSVSLYLS